MDIRNIFFKKFVNYPNLKSRDGVLCPIHLTPLEFAEDKHRVQSLSEHVTNPNGEPSLKTVLKCSCCPGHRRWMTDGSYFTAIDWDMDKESIDFAYNQAYMLDDKDFPKFKGKYKPSFEQNALGSFVAEDNWDSSYGGEPVYWFPEWTIMNNMRVVITRHWVGNSYGDILKEYFEFQLRKRDKHDGEFNLRAEWAINTWKWMWDRFYRKYKNNNLKLEDFESFNKAWVYNWFHNTTKFLFSRTYKSLVNEA